MSSILIIGANGFIGLKLLEKFTLFDTYYTISRSKLNFFNDKTNEYQFDINKQWSFNKYADVILFSATHHPLAKMEPSPINYVDTNINGLIKSLEFAKKQKPKYFIYLSTISIYGDPVDKIVDEDSLVNNPDLYGASKYFAEKILQYYSSYFKILIIRLPGVVDRNMPKDRPWISTVIHKLKNNENVELYNPNSLFNNIIDVDNICNLVENTYKLKLDFKYEIVNLAASNSLKLIKVIQLLKERLKSKSKILCADDIKKNSFVIDISKLSKKMSFTPETTKCILNKIS